MQFPGIADPEDLAVFVHVFEDCCREAGIEADSPDRENMARRIMALFRTGLYTADELKQALKRAPGALG